MACFNIILFLVIVGSKDLSRGIGILGLSVIFLFFDIKTSFLAYILVIARKIRLCCTDRFMSFPRRRESS
ncbi:hypothetical protein [Rickettsia tamurae]|uniref:hypothetical protein n=1 Tax=Rickettsia tamurae TaxID=334545 RepID=UPI001BFD6006|nr:hypothetical protein [Rickettsia tamurae]